MGKFRLALTALCSVVATGVVAALCMPAIGAPSAAFGALLDDYASANCPVESVVEHAGPEAGAALVRARDWLYDDLLHTPDVQVLARVDTAFRSRGVLQYQGRGGRAYRVWWNDFHPPGIPVNRRLVIRTCLFAPAPVDIVDVELGPRRKNAWVLFVAPFRYSWAGRALAAQRLLTRNNTFPLPSDYEKVATFRKTAAHTWEIESVEENLLSRSAS